MSYYIMNNSTGGWRIANIKRIITVLCERIKRLLCAQYYYYYIGRSGQHINLFPVMEREGVEYTKDPPFVPCLGTVHDSSLIRRFCRAEWFSISFSIYDNDYLRQNVYL